MKRAALVNRPGPIAAVLFVLALVALASMRYSPQVYWQGRDDGIYAYDSMVVHSGGVLFRDSWENKPPGLAYTNALGFEVFGVSRWALWLNEMILIAAASLVMLWLMRAVFENWAFALAGAALFVTLARHPDFASDSNFTETYALLPQVLVFALGYRFMRRPSVAGAAAVGVAAAAVALYKLTAVGVALTLPLALILARHPAIFDRRRWRWTAAVLLGGIVPLGLVALYFAANDALAAGIDGMVVAPTAYHNWISQEPVYLWESAYNTLFHTTIPAVMGPLIFFWGAALVAIARREPAPATPPADARHVRTLALWALLTLVVDLLLTNITDRGYRHYYITPVPPMAILIALGLATLLHANWVRGRRVLQALLWAYFLFFMLFRPVQEAVEKWSAIDWDFSRPAMESQVSAYIRAHTAPDDYVFVWGASSEYLFQTQRFSPTQFHYAYPLLIPGYTTDEQLADFMSDLERNQPVLIADAGWSDGTIVPPLRDHVRAQWDDVPRRETTDLTALYDFVDAHCDYETTVQYVYMYFCTYD